MSAPLKKCPRCKRTLPRTTENFWPLRKDESKLGNVCKDCLRPYKAKYDKASKQRNPIRCVASRMKSNVAQRCKLKGWPPVSDLELFVRLIETTPNCPCCGVVLEINVYAGRGHHVSNASISVDRINPSLPGYENNLGVLCYRCNLIKSNATASELKRMSEWVNRLTKEF